MEKNSDPLETLIEFAWACGADRFWVNNAKDELKKLKEKNKEWAIETFKANTFAVEQTKEYLAISAKMQKLKDSIASPVTKTVYPRDLAAVLVKADASVQVLPVSSKACVAIPKQADSSDWIVIRSLESSKAIWQPAPIS